MEKNLPIQRDIHLVVEHMQEYLYDWCMYEYIQMKDYLLDTPFSLSITNAKVIYQYQGKHGEENKKNLQKLTTQFINTKCKLVEDSVTEILMQHKLDEPICMLDMRGEQQLNCNQNWSTLIFGGILGDHPPRDRPAPLRKYFPNIRHLGDLQLATDTAVLISKLILHNKMKLSDIPFVRQPTIKGQNSKGEKTRVQMEGFSYVSKLLNLNTGQTVQEMSKKDKKEVYMSEGVRTLLIEQDLAADLLM